MKRLIEQTACEHGEYLEHLDRDENLCPGGSSREVTVDPCSTCGDSGTVTDRSASEREFLEALAEHPCPSCGGVRRELLEVIAAAIEKAGPDREFLDYARAVLAALAGGS